MSSFVEHFCVCSEERKKKGKKISDVAGKEHSDTIQSLLGVLESIDNLLEEFPPLEQDQRFGNKAFRPFSERLCTECPGLLERVLPENLKGAVVELIPYLAGSFGNSTRLDYGTGHELAFVLILVCMDELNLFSAEDYADIPLLVFDRYLKLCRKIQRLYMLEPAGSHGVWSLDDYQFLCFLWGSAQMIGQQEIKPGSILSKDLVKKEKDEYLYCAAIDYIHVTKTGPFFEHSPVLYNISGVINWEKINGGMFKMFNVEVLGKAPIMQHVYFGSLFPNPFKK